MLNGEKVKTLRTQAGLSAAALGARAGVTGRQIRRYEAGQSQPSFGVAHRIADAVGVDVSSLFIHAPEADTASTGCGTNNPHHSAEVDVAVRSAVAGAASGG